MQLTLTRLEETGHITLNLSVVDDYGREYALIRRIVLVEQVVPATDALITVDGVVLETTSYTVSCSGSYNNFPGATVGFIAIPGNSNDIASVSYKTSSSLSPIKIDSATGEVRLSGASSWLSSYNTNITVTITNNDGSSVVKTFNFKVTKN